MAGITIDTSALACGVAAYGIRPMRTTPHFRNHNASVGLDPARGAQFIHGGLRWSARWNDKRAQFNREARAVDAAHVRWAHDEYAAMLAAEAEAC